MAQFEVTLRDRTVEPIVGADAYQQEGPMTTFFRTDGGTRVDSWSTRVASIRTSEVLLIRRTDEGGAGAAVGGPEAGDAGRSASVTELRAAAGG